MRRKWWMLESVGTQALLCFADGGEGDGGDDKGGGGSDDKGGGATLREKLLGGEGEGDDKGGAALDKVEHKPGTFDQAQLPEQYRGETSDDALAKVYGKLKEYDAGHQERGKVPERSEEYPWKLEGDAAKFFPNPENDLVVGAARKLALKQGWGADQFQNEMGSLLATLTEEGVIDEPINDDAEVEKLGAQGKQLFIEADGYIGRLEAKLSDLKGDEATHMGDIVGELKLQLGTATGVRLVNWIAGLNKETGIGKPGEGVLQGQVTPDKIREWRKDPRYSTTSSGHDPDYRKRVDDQAKAHYGG